MTNPHRPGHWPEAYRDGTLIGEFVSQEIADEQAGLAAENERLRRERDEAVHEQREYAAECRLLGATAAHNLTLMRDAESRNADLSASLAEVRKVALEDAAKEADKVRQNLEKGRKRPLGNIDEHVAGVADGIASRIRALTRTEGEGGK